MAKITLIKNLNGLFVPAYDSDKEIAKKIKVGQAVQVSFTKPRNYEFHKKYFALLNLAFENSDYEMSFEQFREEIIKRAGYYSTFVDFKGVIQYRAKSISFAKMDFIEFEKLYKSTISVIIKYVLQGNTEKEIEENILNFM